MRTTRTLVLSCCFAAALGLGASGAELAWVPVEATGSHTIDGNTIVLFGAGQDVTLEIRVSGWDPELDGDPLLATYQAAVDSTGYDNGVGTPLNPLGWPGSPADGAFITITHPEYVFAGMTSIPAVATPTLDYEWGATLFGGGKADGGDTYYCGTLILEVLAGAQGTYTISLLNDPLRTFLRNDTGIAITPLVLVPGEIAIACQDDEDCDDGNECTDDICTEGVCSNPNFPEGTACGDPSDTICDNPDTCDGDGNCQDNFEPPTFECRPGTDSCDIAEFCTGDDPDCPPDEFEPDETPCPDDGNDCTNDWCISGVCVHPNWPSGTACGDPTDNECTDPDTCDGAGTCETNDEPAGTACGDSADTDCTDPDTCDGAGVCLDNNVPDDTPCDDDLYCNINEVCTAGVCGGGEARDCNDDLDCTDDWCDEDGDTCVNDLLAGYCLIEDVCYDNGEDRPGEQCQECNTDLSTDEWSLMPPGTPCDDGDPCTDDDVCDEFGVCEGIYNPECNDNCENAIPALEGSTTSQNASAGEDFAEASCQPDSNHDIWFVYVASCTGEVFMSTTGSLLAPSNDPVLSVYDECGGAELACDDDSGLDLQAALTFVTTAGEDYFIRVAGFEENVGDVVLNIDTVNDCVIDDVCYPAGATNSANDCEMCIPELDSMGWSFAPEGTACGESELEDPECDDPDACNGAGICEPNHKPDGTECSDDGNECTFDECASGVCAHPPRPEFTPCGDPSDSECDHPDSCDPLGTCLPRFEEYGVPCGDPFEDQCDLHDICDGEGACDVNYVPNGTGCDDGDVCTGDDACQEGECIGILIPVAPLVEREGPKVIKVTPQPLGTIPPIALRLTSPDWLCLDKYIAADGLLTDTPVIQVPDDWGTIIVYGDDIVPSSTYEVVAECDGHTSPLGSGSTCLWADIDCNDVLNFTDIQILVLAFKHDWSPGISFEACDIWPCTPNQIINFDDIQRAVLAFKGPTYEETGCPVPCP